MGDLKTNIMQRINIIHFSFDRGAENTFLVCKPNFPARLEDIPTDFVL